jgi:hypothetical protein
MRTIYHDVIKSWQMRLAGKVAQTGKIRNTYKIFVEKL